jgi:hypothetical protein
MAKRRKPEQPRPERKGHDDLKEAVVLIPLTYNDGTGIPLAVIESIQDELFLVFHGWTIEGTVKGAYRMRGGQKQVEDLLKLSVVLAAAQLPALESMVGRWCARLGQEVMLLKVADSLIKFVPPEAGAGPS